jgi:hypothetical protein
LRRSFAGSRLKFRKAEVFVNVFPDHFNRHITKDLIRVTAYDIGEELRAFFQFYDGDDIGEVFLKSRVKRLVINYKGEHRSSTGRFNTFMGNRMAPGADDGGRPSDMATVIAFLEG